jgi:pyrroloquinoline-quinone synthase
MTADNFIAELGASISARKKMTSRLYQVIMAGNATQQLLRSMVLQRWPIKSHWTRNILGIASCIDDYQLRCNLVENIYEEETGKLSNSKRHLEAFANFGVAVGVTRGELERVRPLPETQAVVDHNVRVCNTQAHFTAGVASVLLLMEGQPPIVDDAQRSMEWVMKHLYQLPSDACEFFHHHASSSGDASHVSHLEDNHAVTAREILARYCVTIDLQAQAKRELNRALDLRHKHFDALVRLYYNSDEPPFRWSLPRGGKSS